MCQLCYCSTDSHLTNNDMIVSWNKAHFPYIYEENIVLSDGAAEFEGGLQ